MDNLSKYLEDISFISWVFEPTSELNLFWKKYGIEHPEESNRIILARKIILQFRTVAKPLSEEEKIRLFSKVLEQIESKEKSRKNIRIFMSMAKYAAVAIFFFSIGALLFYKPNTVNPAFYSFNMNDAASDDQVKLIRSNGEDVILENNRSVIKYQKDGELVINSDTIKSDKLNSASSQSFNQLIIPYGKTSEILLSDGTKVFLNAGSRLVYPDKFIGNSREVMLFGEAYFEVKHDSKQPFIVQVNDLRIKDLGTKFNISAYPSDGRVETVLTEGKISLKANNSGLFSTATELIPGQLATFDRQTTKINVKTVNVDDYILWTQGMMKFETVDLSRIVKKLERFYNIKLQFNDPMLGTLIISGKLGLNESREEVLERIARTASVNIVKKGEDFYTIMK